LSWSVKRLATRRLLDRISLAVVATGSGADAFGATEARRELGSLTTRPLARSFERS
jgi:hypothetical protein